MSVFFKESNSLLELGFVSREQVELQGLGAYSEVTSALLRPQNLPNLFRDSLSVIGGVSFSICESDEISCREGFLCEVSRRILPLSEFGFLEVLLPSEMGSLKLEDPPRPAD